MSRTIVEITAAWPDKEQPTTAWIISVGRTGGGGQGFAVSYDNLRVVNGNAIDMPSELAKGAGAKKAKFHPGKGGKGKRRMPTSLSLVCTEDVIIGLVLDKSMKAEFDPAGPFSGGYDGASDDYFEATYVTPSTAYLKARAGGFGDDYVKEFNIHLIVRNKFPDGEENETPIILDPEMRIPPPGYGAN